MLCSGGGNIDNIEMNQFGPALRWMHYEGLVFGLLASSFTGTWPPTEIHNSMSLFYWIQEWLPLKRALYGPKAEEVAKMIHWWRLSLKTLLDRPRETMCGWVPSMGLVSWHWIGLKMTRGWFSFEGLLHKADVEGHDRMIRW